MDTGLTRELIAKIMRDKITFSGQVGDYVIHGAIDEIMSAHYAAIFKCDDEFNHLVRVCNDLAKAGCRHDLHVINEWVEMYTNDDGTINWRKILLLSRSLTKQRYEGGRSTSMEYVANSPQRGRMEFEK